MAKKHRSHHEGSKNETAGSGTHSSKRKETGLTNAETCLSPTNKETKNRKKVDSGEQKDDQRFRLWIPFMNGRASNDDKGGRSSETDGGPEADPKQSKKRSKDSAAPGKDEKTAEKSMFKSSRLTNFLSHIISTHKQAAPAEPSKNNTRVGKTPSKGRSLNQDSERMASEFVEYTLKQGIEGLKKEFENLPKRYPEAFETRNFNEHMAQNRYKDVSCLDATRVVLRLNVPPDTDYIHANRVEMADVSELFIMTQAPIPTTVNDFWRMCFQESAGTIVMLCSFLEAFGHKCDPYWPKKERSRKEFGCMHIKCCKVTKIDEVPVYHLEMLYYTPNGKHSRKLTKLYHIEEWPDRAVPSNARSVVNVLRRVDKTNACVIHCSAGIGRAGAAVAIETAIERFVKGKQFDVKSIVEELRCKRSHSVQTNMHYVFIYYALLEYIKCKLPKHSDKVVKFRHAFKEAVVDQGGLNIK